jgi:hypothetical protein
MARLVWETEKGMDCPVLWGHDRQNSGGKAAKL